MADIKYVRLTTGENVIAEVEEQGDKIKLTNPIIAVPNGDNLGFVPFVTLGSKDIDSVVIKDEHVLFIAEPASEIKDHFATTFGKIITPKSKLVV